MDWNWSFRAFQLFGTDVRIHWTLPAFFIYYVLRAATYGPSALFIALFVITPFILLFASVLAHEFGHIFAARHFRMPAAETILTPIGGMAMVGPARTAWSEFAVAIWGPLINVFLAAFGLVLYLSIGGPFSASLLVPFAADNAFAQLYTQERFATLVVYDFVQTNAMLFLFNMMMIAYPLDGGRVLFSVLWKQKGYRPGMVLACKVSRVVAVLMGIAALLTLSPILGVIAFFVFMQAQMMLKRVHLLPEPGYGVAAPQRSKGAGPLRAWLLRRKLRHIQSLLDKAKTDGIHELTDAEREVLRRSREEKKGKDWLN